MADVPDQTPADYSFGPRGLWRGDTRVDVHAFNDDPPAWQPGTVYAAGDLQHPTDEEYVAQTTCSYDGTPYTCLAAHTSAATFDPGLWSEDGQALGPATDISGYQWLGQYRENSRPTATVLAFDEFEPVTDGTDGKLQRTLTAEQAALLVTDRVSWDLQGTKGAVVHTFLAAIDVPVRGDYSREEV